MRKNYRIFLTSVAFAAFPIEACVAHTLDIGFVQFLQGSNTETAGFNVLNDTGPNASAPQIPAFPVTTPVPLSNLTLYVNYADGTADVFTPKSGYFALAADKLSSIGAEKPKFMSKAIVSALLTGTFGVTSLTLNDGTHVYIQPNFTAQIANPSGTLQVADFAYIKAATGLDPLLERDVVSVPPCCLAALAFPALYEH
jgi:hypothetical protein